VSDEPQEEVPGAGAPNRTLVYIMVGVVALFVIAGLAKGKKEEKPAQPTPPANARALVLPSDDAERTVVIAPCDTDVEETLADAKSDRATPNTVRLRFPKGGGDRALLVPDCSSKTGVSASRAGVPAAAFVLPVGTRENRLQVPPLRAESQVLVQNGSPARTVVLGPCTGKTGGEGGKPSPSIEGGQNKDAVLAPEDGDGDVAAAPPC
jgi:hypothetical protein